MHNFYNPHHASADSIFRFLLSFSLMVERPCALLLLMIIAGLLLISIIIEFTTEIICCYRK